MFRREGDGTVYLYAPYDQADGFAIDRTIIAISTMEMTSNAAPGVLSQTNGTQSKSESV